MNINELHPTLKQMYDEVLELGIVSGVDAKNPQIYFVVPPPPPREKKNIQFSIKLMGEAQSILNRLPTYDEMDELDKLINYLFVRREALHSSRLEGTWSTIDAVLTPVDIEEDAQSDGTKSIIAYARALENIFSEAYRQKESIFSLETVCKIHKEMMEKDSSYMGIPGQLRSPGQPGSVVYIGGRYRPEDSVYNPAPPAYVKQSLDKVLNWYSDKDLASAGDVGIGMNLIMRIAIGHSHFEAVHPFTDGNGRVGRALWPLQMVTSGTIPLYLSGYVEKEKVDYYKALEEAQKKLNYTPMIEFICEAIISSSLELKITKDRILSMPAEWRKREKFKKGSTSDKALEFLRKSPIFTTSDLKKEIGCSVPAAARAVNEMVEKKIIRERTGNKRNRIFAAEEIIWLLGREHGSDADLALDKAKRLLNSKTPSNEE